MRTQIGWVVFIMSYLAYSANADQGDEAAELRRIRQDYQEAVSKLETHFATMRGSGRVSLEVLGGEDAETHSFTAVFARKPGMLKHIITDYYHQSKEGRTHQPDQASCANPAMSFALTREPGAKAFSLIGTGEPAEKMPTKSFLIIRDFLCCAYSFSASPLPRELADPSFSLRKVEKIRHLNKPMLRLYFHSSRKPPKGSERARLLNDVRLVVSPEDKWATYEYEATYILYPGGRPSPRIRTGWVEYGPTESGFPVPKRAVHKTVRLREGDREQKDEGKPTVRDGDVSGIQTFVFDRLEFEAEPDESFILAAFGLPEIGKPTPSARRGYGSIPFFVAAAVFLIAAILLRAYASRSRRDGNRVVSSGAPPAGIGGEGT